MQELLKTIRESTTPRQWSQGVELNRRSDFIGHTWNPEKVVLRVAERGQSLSRSVTLWLEDEDWNCDCGDKNDPCTHVIAAAIAVKQAFDRGEELPSAQEVTSTVLYRFKRKDGALWFERALLCEGKTSVLHSSISIFNSKNTGRSRIVPTREDLAVDLLLRESQSGVFSPVLLGKIIDALVDHENVFVDDTRVHVSNKRTGFIARVEGDRNSARLYGIQDPSITEIFRNGVALCGDVLRPIGQNRLLPSEIKMLAGGQTFGQKEIIELISEIIPQLEKKLSVEIHARLPEVEHCSPRIYIATRKDNNTLTVFPQIVYGDPIIAHVERERLILHGARVPSRNLREEQKLHGRLATELSLDPATEARFRGDEAVFFAERLHRWKGDVDPAGLEHFRLRDLLTGDVTLQRKDGAFALKIEFLARGRSGDDDGVYEADPVAVLKAWENGDSIVPLLTGGWAPIPAEWLKKHGETLSVLLGQRTDKTVTLANWMLPDLRNLFADLDQEFPPELLRTIQSLADFSNIPAAPLPADLQATLRDYQLHGVNWLSFLRKAKFSGALLADDMGLGKTLQAICVLQGQCLVIAPTSVIHNWEIEIRKFRPALACSIYHGPSRSLPAEGEGVVLTSYAIMRLDNELLAARTWDMIVLDEAQNIKNPQSLVAQSSYRLRGNFKIALTGTPIENRLEDVWSQFRFLIPDLLGPLKMFQRQYVKSGGGSDAPQLVRLKERLRPFLLRRSKKEVAKELPPRTDVVLYCELNEDEQNLYNSIKAATQREVLQQLELGVGVLKVLEALLRLRQAACHGGLLPGQTVQSSSKIDLLTSTLQECIDGNHKALVFSQWTSLLDRIEGPLAGLGIPFLRIDGSTKNRSEIVQEFQSDSGPPVLLLSLKAAGVGLNLTAADHVFIVDPWWNPAVENQAADRAHRIGQDKPVIVHRLVSTNTVEERILLLQERKREIADTLIVSGGTGAVELTKEDLLSLLY